LNSDKSCIEGSLSAKKASGAQRIKKIQKTGTHRERSHGEGSEGLLVWMLRGQLKQIDRKISREHQKSEIRIPEMKSSHALTQSIKSLILILTNALGEAKRAQT
jgi:hypothetical protein